MNYYLAVDIGASSGRHILGWKEDGKILTRELYRFPNGMKELDGHLTWDINELFSHVQHGIDEAMKEYPVEKSSDEKVHPYLSFKRMEAQSPATES